MSKLISIAEPAGHRPGPAPGAPAKAPWALWALGFRPFYLLAAAFAALSVPLWALQFGGWLGGVRSPLWHAHEMVFGYALAVIVGFLFTAGRNWSGQPTPTGRSLQALVALWVAGRVLVWTPWPVASLVVGVAFPWAAAIGLGRALVAGGNRRNYFFVAVLLGMGLAQGMVQAALAGWLAWPAGFGLQLGLDAVLFVMAVMGGRVIPMFSNNGAPGTDAQRQPWVEQLALGSVLALWACDAAGVPDTAVAAVAFVAAAAHAVRLALWHPWRTRRAPLVWVLHAAYAWIVVHLLLRAAATAQLLPPGIATHALTIGALGTLTLGMMTRTARGHLGRPLRAEGAEVAIYAGVLAAAAVRVAVPLAWPSALPAAALISSVAWCAAFATYAFRYGPWLCRARVDGKPG